MWLKVGTRGDYRVIYFIIAFFFFLGIRSAYYSLYDLNGGPEKTVMIDAELNTIMPTDNRNPNSIVRLQYSKITEHLGGARDCEKTFHTTLSKENVINLYENNAIGNGWEKVNDSENFVKEAMQMKFRFVDESEYASKEYGVPKHLQGKTIFRIRIEIK